MASQRAEIPAEGGSEVSREAVSDEASTTGLRATEAAPERAASSTRPMSPFHGSTLMGVAPPPRPTPAPTPARPGVAPAVKPRPLSAGSVFAGDFKIVCPIAKGGMGAVFEVEQLSTGRSRALKVLHGAERFDERARRRFLRETRASAVIESQHVVEVVVAGIDEATGAPWMAMELLRGETVAQRLARLGDAAPMPTRDAWVMLAHVLRGLAKAHARGVVHRDLKPENLFVSDAPCEGAPFTVKLLDFGIACFFDPRDQGIPASVPIGTPLWMAPEQASAGPITPAADVWAVGLIAFRLFSGRHYLINANEPSPDMASVLEELLQVPLSSASERAEQLGCVGRLPMGFDGWFSRCVARDPAERFADAGAAAAALAEFSPPATFSTPPPVQAPARREEFHEAPTVRVRHVVPEEITRLVAEPMAFRAARAPESPREVPRTPWKVYGAVVLCALLLGGAAAVGRSSALSGRARASAPRVASARAQGDGVAEPGAPSPAAWPPDAQRVWRGVASGDDAQYAFLLVLRMRDGDRVAGFASWTVVRAAGAQPGEEVRENVQGTYEPTLGTLDLHGTMSTNALVYPVSAYRLRVAGDQELRGGTTDGSLNIVAAPESAGAAPR